jgi:hypothetical protein
MALGVVFALKYPYWPSNIRIGPQTSVFAPEFNFKLYSNILKRVNLIEIRFYAPSFLAL